MVTLLFLVIRQFHIYFFELVVLENFAFAASFRIILTLEAFGHVSQHERKVLPVSNNSCV